ncbi:VOC family protein [Actinokineospora inagensis]|uniref:VOC family protein n=1 Tax=Actinokineospora inagensis TaxID=103730 RepID=UPI0004276456|nr:VOC family protein [Actinokineospora inagensis]
MVTRSTPWQAGTPCWIDLASDVERAAAFYSALFGWRVDISPEFGGYANCYVGDDRVAGIGPLQEGQPTVWSTYLSSEDTEADVAKIVAAGGQVVVPPLQVGPLGTMAVAVDPTGAAFGLWQAGTHTGVTLANEPGSLSWNEQLSGDFDGAKAFYASLYGFDYHDVSAPGMTYATIHLDDPERPVGGIGAAQAGAPARWWVYFSVTDTDATVAKVVELGGSSAGEPFDTPYGRQAIVADDQGASFVVITLPKS